MPLRLNVGVSRKVGLPDYCSVGASCNVEIELSQELLDHDLQTFQDRVRTAYVAAHQAVHDELARLQQPVATGSSLTPTPTARRRRIANGRHAARGRDASNGQGHHGSGRAACTSAPLVRHDPPDRCAACHRSSDGCGPGRVPPRGVRGRTSRATHRPAGQPAHRLAQGLLRILRTTDSGRNRQQCVRLFGFPRTIRSAPLASREVA